MSKIEVLAPAGSAESFNAAIKAKADAIYLGLDKFNARQRAKNFSLNQLASIIKTAHKSNCKVYVTLNTLIKNNELKDLLDFLNALQQINPDSVIIQDWGVYYLVKNYFKKLKIHSSTQMGCHNTENANFFYDLGFGRVILSREITMPELKNMAVKAKPELEIFVHGALCYSFSGNCLFSSFLGGQSANRGGCRQPCRRKYNGKFAFNLKDFELIDFLPEFEKMGIASIKIEGRMKPAEYVFKTVSAYKGVITKKTSIVEAKSILQNDLAREKTKYFIGQNVDEAINSSPFTGIEIGQVAKTDAAGFWFKTLVEFNLRDRLRVMPNSGTDAKLIKISKIKNEKNELIEQAKKGQYVWVKANVLDLKKGYKIFYSGSGEFKFSNKIMPEKIRLKPFGLKQKVLNELKGLKTKAKPEIYFRINNLEWLKKVHFDSIDKLIIKPVLADFDKILTNNFLQKKLNQVIVQLPLFIPEEKLGSYKQICQKLFSQGFKNFMLSGLWQKNIVPKGSSLYASEQIYTLNDAASLMLKKMGFKNWVYPFENDNENLCGQNNKNGIIPVYFYPQLFYSRMPVKLENEFKDRDTEYLKHIEDGFTIVTPKLPVSVIQYKNKFDKWGYKNYLIDLSYAPITSNLFKRLVKKLKNSEAEKPSYGFNYKKGLF